MVTEDSVLVDLRACLLIYIEAVQVHHVIALDHVRLRLRAFGRYHTICSLCNIHDTFS